MKTSRYSNPEIDLDKHVPVGITLYPPRFKLRYKLMFNLRSIAPTKELFGVNERTLFTQLYFEKMDRIGVKTIVKEILAIQKHYPRQEMVLLCYEDVRKPMEWCHRQVFAEWWKARTGQQVDELQDSSPIKYSKQERIAILESEIKQGTFFD